MLKRTLMLGLLLTASAGVAGAQGGNVPASPDAPKVGEKLAEFVLPDAAGKDVRLVDLLAVEGAPRTAPALLLIFYRGYW